MMIIRTGKRREVYSNILGYVADTSSVVPDDV